ncbi:MAG: hypothetical protein Q9202_006924 [Teloschistes flavicans]
MASTSKELLLSSIKSLLAEAEKLPNDIFEDHAHRGTIQRQLMRLRNQTSNPIERILGEICFQPHLTAAVRIALENKWFDVLQDGHPKTAQAIASATGAEPELIARLMMVLTTTGVVDEQSHQTYLATPVTQSLLDPGWANAVRHFFDHCGPSLQNLPDYFARNNYKNPQDVAKGPFAAAWGGKHTWALFQAEPKRGEIFNSCMAKFIGPAKWTDSYPVKTRLCDQIEKSASSVLLVDIGGNSGYQLKDFVKDPARRTGRLIVQDLSMALGNEDDLAKLGIESVAYDFFTPQPIIGAKAYYLRAVLHDWPDSACREILGNVRAAMRPGYSKLLIDEMVLPDTDVPPIGAFLDLTMMALETGAERTSKQWHDLLASAGLRIEKIWEGHDGMLESLIEAELAD